MDYKIEIGKKESEVEVLKERVAKSTFAYSKANDELKKLIKEYKSNISNADKARENLGLISYESVCVILNEYFEVAEVGKQSVAGKVMITNATELKKDTELYNIIISYVGGDLIYDCFGFMLDSKIVDGEKVYHHSIKDSRKWKTNKKKLTRRLRKKEILSGLLKYGVKYDLGVPVEGLE